MDLPLARPAIRQLRTQDGPRDIAASARGVLRVSAIMLLFAGSANLFAAGAWVEDALPAGAVPGGIAEGWNWTSSAPAPFSGALAHQSALAAGLHQHYFHGATAPQPVGVNDRLYAYVYLDPANPPSEVMLQWNDGNSWEHRVYWGANTIGWGVDGTASRRYMGPVPATGQWLRLSVPAAQVGLDGKSITGMAFTLYDGRATWDQAGVETGAPPSATGWVDDAMPAGATPAGIAEGWDWVSSNPAPFAGTLAHRSALATGVHQHYFMGATTPLPVGVDDTLYAYVYLDPANPPAEVMLQWHDGTNWKHRAYWGANNIGWGVDGTTSRRYMGPLPATGQWVRLTVSATDVGLDGKSISGMAFSLYDGRATWDLAGVQNGPPRAAWVDDAMPAGAGSGGIAEGWNWVSTNPVPLSGGLAHQSALANGVHQHYFYGAAPPMPVAVGDTLFAHVYLDPANPPSEVMLQWNDGGSWEHRAYWGANSIGWGTDGTASRRYMGPLPATGKWVRLSVAAAQVGLEGKSISGMAFTLYDGRATWDRAGVESGTPASTTTTLSSSANPVLVGTPVTFTATVSGNGPGGTVNFTAGETAIAGCVPVALAGTGNSRTAICLTNALTAGTHDIRATYGGDAGNVISVSATLQQIVAAPPAVFTEKDAARLLQQGTWGATLDEIRRVAGIGADAWLAEQFAVPATSYTAYAQQNIADNKLGAHGCTDTQNGCPWQVAFPTFYKQAFEGGDQLRQRVVNALTQIAVISTANGRLNDAGTAMPNYLDMLGTHAFGNFRNLLRDVALHPAMGIYLDMLGSTLEVPNENFAREMLQLFSIGTVMLNDDGTPRKDAQGNTIATYDESVVQGFAKAYTGWHFADQDMTKSWKFYWPDAKWTVPMQPWTARRCPQDGRWPAGSTTGWCDLANPAKSYPPPHDTGTKKLLQYPGAPYATLPAGQTPQTDVENAIDNIFNHPNVGPFVVTQLIQRLVTSNPTPAYVQRVVGVFNNNGSGVRGDMKAVVRAILLDAEARSATVAAGNTFGKLREPVAKFLHLHRAFNARTSSGYYDIWDLSDPEELGQAPLRAPSVFNFYGADFAPAGPVGQAGLVGPEFEIMSTSVVSGFSEFTKWAVYGGFGSYESDKGKWIKPEYDRYLVGTGGNSPLADNPQALVDELDLLLTAGNLKPAFKTSLVAALNKVTRSAAADQRNDRFRIALWQIVHSAEYAVQR